jgi:putative ABC transport system permease protein
MRHAIRLFARTPVSTLAAVATLALAIGASTLVFSVLDAVLFRELPYRDPERLVAIWEANPQRGLMANVVSPANFLFWRDLNRSFSRMAAVSPAFRSPVASGRAEPEIVPLQVASADLFSMLGVGPLYGRVFTSAEEEPNSRVVVVSHRFWRTRLGGRVGAIGQTIRMSGDPLTVIGIMPPGFSVLYSDVDLWLPVGFTEEARQPKGRWLAVVARLRDGATLTSAQTDMTAVAATLTKRFPDFNTGWTARVLPLHEQVTGRIAPALKLLAGAVLCVLLIGCANVANLLLARGSARSRELAVRAALGAERARLVRQMLGECLALSVAGGLVGWGIAVAGLRIIRASVVDSGTLPRLDEVALDARVVAFAVVASGVATILAGLFPAVSASRLALVDALKDGSRGHTSVAGARMRPILVAAEVALAVVLLSGAGLLMRSLSRLIDVDPGFRAERVSTMAVILSGPRYEAPVARTTFFSRLTAAVAALPGVEAVGAISDLPMTGLGSATGFEVVGRPKPAPGQEPVADVRIVSGDYFGAMGIPLLKGRLFEPTDTGDRAHVIVINQALADELFPGEDPLGRQLVLHWTDTIPDRIVGVVGNVLHTGLDARIRPMTYWPHDRFANGYMWLTVKSQEGTSAIGPVLGRMLRRLDADVPLTPVKPMADVLVDTVATRRLVMSLIGIFAALAFVLAALGIYSVMTCVVTERRAELAIRLALGAQPRNVIGRVVGEALATTAAGAACGLAAALALGRLLRSLLFETAPTDPIALATPVVLLLVVGIVASWAPGLTASRVDPMKALRAE